MKINPETYTHYPLKVAGLERQLPICKVNDGLYIAAFVIFGDVELTSACARELIKKLPEHDILITAESKGIPLVYEMARQLGENKYLIARKGAKLYMKDPHSVEVQSITTSRKQTLFIDKDDIEHMKGKRVVIVDDVISTGESLFAVEKLVKESGGIVAARMAILAEGDAKYRDDIVYLEQLPLFFPEK
ncbi:MAG TPA: phosphoribosyltransferase family protein [Bacillota bacterium]|nr:phosphoribosyltransferase family protein [Bacillota bacterium]